MAFSRKKSKESSGDRLIMSENSSFLMKEDYRALRTNIIFSFPDNSSKVIAYTSAARHEGKSTNAINTAISFAELDKKVLLVDCDMRLPTVGEKLGMQGEEEASGLSDLLVGNVTANEAIEYLKEKDIYVLRAGTIPPDPTRLLQSKKMESLMNSLRKAFDIIVLDCPPVTEVIDAALLAPYVDGFLLLARHDGSDLRNIRRMLEELELANAKILGFVYSNVPTGDKKFYQNGYYEQRYSKKKKKK